MNRKIESELLETKTLNEFRNIILKNNIKEIRELSEDVLQHFNLLGGKQSAKYHIDPRKNI